MNILFFTQIPPYPLVDIPFKSLVQWGRLQELSSLDSDLWKSIKTNVLVIT